MLVEINYPFSHSYRSEARGWAGYSFDLYFGRLVGHSFPSGCRLGKGLRQSYQPLRIHVVQVKKKAWNRARTRLKTCLTLVRACNHYSLALWLFGIFGGTGYSSVTCFSAKLAYTSPGHWSHWLVVLSAGQLAVLQVEAHVGVLKTSEVKGSDKIKRSADQWHHFFQLIRYQGAYILYCILSFYCFFPQSLKMRLLGGGWGPARLMVVEG